MTPRRNIRWTASGRAFLALGLLLASALRAQTPSRGVGPAAEGLATAVDRLVTDLPRPASPELRDAVQQTISAAVALTQHSLAGSDTCLHALESLAEGHELVEAQRARLLADRAHLGSLPAGPDRRDALRAFLDSNLALLEVSSRLDDQLRGLLADLAYEFPQEPGARARVIDWVAEREPPFGAAVLARLILAEEVSRPERSALVEWLGRSGDPAVVPLLARVALDPATPSATLVRSADAILELGLPQPPFPGTEDRFPAPAITAAALLERLQAVDPAALDAGEREAHSRLLGVLHERSTTGVGTTYTAGGVRFRSGDWLLFRNPSPYDRFTDLAPGLFTHVGLIARHVDERGFARMVVVDLNEQQPMIVGENVETNLPLPLFYAVLRPKSPQLAEHMGSVAASLIGSPMQFDLTFDTARVEALPQAPPSGSKVTTYCSGLLLLCVAGSGAAPDELFPVRERLAGGFTAANFERSGLELRDRFLSPTGAFLSPHVDVVRFRPPVYDPSRRIEQTIFDHFAERLRTRELSPQHDFLQALRSNLADSAEANPLLRGILARAAGVDPGVDLSAGARTLAVLETLDATAFGTSADFRVAFRAVMGPPPEVLQQQGLPEPEAQRIALYRQDHQRLVSLLGRRRITAEDALEALIAEFVQLGRDRLDQRLFGGPAG